VARNKFLEELSTDFDDASWHSPTRNVAVTEGLLLCNFYFYNPSVTATPRHLPLHKGGFLFACKCALTHHLMVVQFRKI